MQLKIALPKGYLLNPTSDLLQRAGVQLVGYDGKSRSYRPQCTSFPNLSLKVFHEKDIPVQVAIGNYDIGICGRDWVEELLAKYPSSEVIKVLDLSYGRSSLLLTASQSAQANSIYDLAASLESVRIATEYPNLAESVALRLRLRRFSVFPLWGSAEAYPPENADLALVSLLPGRPLYQGLVSLSPVLHSTACLIAHRSSWESKDLSPLLQRLYDAGNVEEEASQSADSEVAVTEQFPPVCRYDKSIIRLGLPDGHQQEPTFEFLARAGITIEDNPSDPPRPKTNIDGISMKMIRPQDMALQVANGNFDLAITGEDWLNDHLYRFPSSPVRKILRLGFGKVSVVAVVINALPADSTQDFRKLIQKGDFPTVRIASEYTNVADKYARDNHLSPHRLIPTWGASEVFLPEDADLLIENVQTGQTLAQNNLKIIDTIFESSACLIGSTGSDSDGSKLERMNRLIDTLRQAINES